jgi:formate dehydrogenase subunit beta
MKTGRLTTSGGAVEAAAAFLKGLLTGGIVDEVLVPAAQPGGGVAMAAFADAESLSRALPWAPVMPVQGARMVSRLAFTDPGAPVAVVLRPCEARAAVELIKLKQILPDRLLFVTVDCPGTCEAAGFHASGRDAAEASRTLLSGMKTGETALPGSVPLRLACTVCENPSAEWGAVRLQLFGGDPAAGVSIAAEDEAAAKLEKAGLASFDGKGAEGRAGVVGKVVSARTAARDALFAKFSTEAKGLDGLKKVFATCIRCLNCMENCPICYCKLCIFRSPTLDYPGERYARWAKRKGAQKLPAETMLFHLTRLNHMASSCIGCGLCDTACPMGLPVATLFRKVAGEVQRMLEYVPGRGLEDPIPLSVFREDELQDESGARD